MASKRTKDLGSAALWAAMFIAYQLIDPAVSLYVDLAIIFGLMPVVAGLVTWLATRPWNNQAGSGIPVDRGDENGYSIRLTGNLRDQIDVNRIEGLLMLHSASVGRLERESLVSGTAIFTGVPEKELQLLIDQFRSRGIAVSVDASRGDDH